MKKAVSVLKELSADERNRMILDDREKMRRDIASREQGARKEGINEGKIIGLSEGKREKQFEVARNAILLGLDVDTIIKLTSLTREEIETA
jgi:predicted transposase/invertase (TIGR01784 family)